jgi:hypothetical protein
MKFSAALCCLGFVSALCLPAATITDLYNTGVDATGKPLAPNSGATDPHYMVLSSPNNTGTPHAAVTYNCCYFSDGPNSDWISVNTSGSDGSSGFYDYQTKFTILPGFDPTTASITGKFAGDNHVSQTKINGSAVAGDTTDTFSSYTSFSINSGFISGVNTLDFIVKDDGAPSALRVDSLVGTVSPLTTSGVPEPVSALLLIGGAGLLGMCKRLSSRRFHR